MRSRDKHCLVVRAPERKADNVQQRAHTPEPHLWRDGFPL